MIFLLCSATVCDRHKYNVLYQKTYYPYSIRGNVFTTVVHLDLMYNISSVSVLSMVLLCPHLLLNMRLKKWLAAANTTLWAGKVFP